MNLGIRAFRFLLKNKTYLAINVLGLGIGTASFVLLFLYIYNDITYDLFNAEHENIYRIKEGDGHMTKGTLLPVLLDEIPEIKDGTRRFDWIELRLSYGDKAFPENVIHVDTGFFNLFSFPFISGSPEGALSEKYAAVISEEFAQKYFGNASAVGKKLRVGFENTFLTIAGVVKIPDNSSVKFGVVTSYETGESLSPWIKDVHDWYNTFSETYVLLNDGVKPEILNQKFREIVKERFIPVGQSKANITLLPLKDLHGEMSSNKSLVIILSVIAFGIVGIVVVNFINLTFAGSLTRNMEISVKKVNGAKRSHLFGQLMTESLLVSFLATILGVVIAYLALPYFNKTFESHITLNPFDNLFLLPALALIWVATGVLSGIIPSIFWARAKLINALKGQVSGQRGTLSRYSLIIFQFVITITLISGALLIRKQIVYMMSRDAKFDKENVIIAQLDGWQYEDDKAASRKFQTIYDELQKESLVEATSFSQEFPGQYNENYNSFFPEEEWTDVEKVSLRQAYVGEGYFETYGIKVIEGRYYDPAIASDKNAVIINETAMKKLGFKSAAGKVLHDGSKDGPAHVIIGVVEDFHYQGLQREIQPLIHFFQKRETLVNWNCLSVRSKPGAGFQVVEILKQKWHETEPSATLNFLFANERLNQHYAEFVKINAVVGYFSALAVLLSCMGLFAVCSFVMIRKTKEIGIRKVNGAKVSEILTLLNKSFIRWVAIAFVIATPIAWYAMRKWLENFAYKTELSWWIFALAGVLALGIALLTVSWQSWKAATRNPVEALRYE